MKTKIKLRQQYNKKILSKLNEFVDKYPDLRFGQILGNFILQYEIDKINDVSTVIDPYHEESVDMFNRIKDK